MGCGCCVTTFRDEVEGEVFSYIKRLKKGNEEKNNLIQEIQKDLLKRCEIIEKYNYPYRYDDVEKTVKIYKNYIYRKFKGHVELLEDKIKSKDKQEKQTKQEIIKTDENKLTLKDKSTLICVFYGIWNDNNEVDDILTYIIPEDKMSLTYEEMYDLAFKEYSY